MKWVEEKERRDYLNNERVILPAGKGGILKVALIYPDSYELGMSNLGFQLIYYVINSVNDVCAERFFWPKDALSIESFKSLETGRSICDFHILAFSLSFELHYLRVAKVIKILGLPLEALERENTFPLIIAGGACSFYNPLPLKTILDCWILGEGEEPLSQFLQITLQGVTQNYSKKRILANLIDIPGVFSVWNDCGKIYRRYYKDFATTPSHSIIVTPYSKFPNMGLVEIARGCKFKCRFCIIGNNWPPFRIKNYSEIKKSIAILRDKCSEIGLLAPLVNIHPEIINLCKLLKKEKKRISISSLRINKQLPLLIKEIINSGSQALTLAPETGSEELRFSTGKKFSNELTAKVIESAFKIGLKTVKLYFMWGIPKENFSHLYQTVSFLKELITITPRNCRLKVSFSPFIPKPGTPWETECMLTACELNIRKDLINKQLGTLPRIKLVWESIRWSQIQAISALADENFGKVLIKLLDTSGKFNCWQNTFKEVYKVSIEDYLKGRHLNLYSWQVVTRAPFWEDE